MELIRSICTSQITPADYDIIIESACEPNEIVRSGGNLLTAKGRPAPIGLMAAIACLQRRMSSGGARGNRAPGHQARQGSFQERVK